MHGPVHENAVRQSTSPGLKFIVVSWEETFSQCQRVKIQILSPLPR